MKTIEWISTDESPLIITDKSTGIQTISDAAQGYFLAALKYKDTERPGEALWWICLCTTNSDGDLISVFGNDSEEAETGWGLEDVEFYAPIKYPTTS